MEYQGYIGTVEEDAERGIFRGRVRLRNGVITFQASLSYPSH